MNQRERAVVDLSLLLQTHNLVCRAKTELTKEPLSANDATPAGDVSDSVHCSEPGFGAGLTRPMEVREVEVSQTDHLIDPLRSPSINSWRKG